MHDSSTAGAQAGFTLVEVLVAAFLVVVGLVALLAAFDATGRTALAAQRHGQAVSYAQREIERLRTLDYDTQLGVTSLPAGAASTGNAAGDPTPDNPVNPLYYVTGTSLKVMANYSNRNSGLQAGISPNPEPLVGPADPKLTDPRVNPGPEPFVDGPTTGKVYRFVTYRKESCGGVSILGVSVANPCSVDALGQPDGKDSKRVTVAVVLDSLADKAGPSKPVWMSSVVTDPNAAPLGVQLPPQANPGSGAAVTAQPFFLYDTPCHNATRQTVATPHATHNSAQAPLLGVATSCVAPNEPDLMSNDAPPGTITAPIGDFSNDVARSAPVGLALQRSPSGNPACPTTYSSSGQKAQIHTWASPASSPAFVIPPTGARAALSIWTQTIDGNPGRGILCATLRDALTGATLGSGTYDQANWPTTPSQLDFTFALTAPLTVPVGDRLLLTVSLQSGSTNNVELLYDHPSYASFLAVTTTTPLP